MIRGWTGLWTPRGAVIWVAATVLHGIVVALKRIQGVRER